MQKYVPYLRVSTQRQGRSGLGLEAQREAVRVFVGGRGGKLLAPEYVEVESGKRGDRPELLKALQRCRVTRATLVVAKLDRLSRNAAFLLTLRDSGIDFIAADLPEANTMTVGVMAVVAQHEREAISQRTRAALAAAKRRGVKLGGKRKGGGKIGRYQRKGVAAAMEAADRLAQDRLPVIEGLQVEGLSLNAIAKRLNEDGVVTARGGLWTATAVRRVMERVA